ncbi:MAG: hypothetical protein IJC73_06335 [Lentisphaeria bacterium]|nr:hypothetical protein [Lentisphaeria bacterium]
MSIRYRCFRLLTILLAAAPLLPATVAAERDMPRLKLGGRGDLSRLGISIRLFENMTQLPPPAPTTVVLTRTADGSQIPVIHRREFWLHQQTAGSFSGSGCSIRLFRPALPPPDDLRTLKQEFLRETDFRAWQNQAVTPDFTDPAERTKWLKAAFGDNDYQESDRFVLLRKNDQARLYLLNRPPAGTGQVWGIVLLAVPANWPDEVFTDAMQEMAGSITFTHIPDNKPRRRTAARPAAAGVKRSPAYEASRRRVIDSIKSLKDWWYIETEHFIIVSNISRRKDVRRIADEAEQIRTLYEKLMPPPAEPDAVSVIRIFDDRDQYNAYIGSGAEWTGGCWMAHKQELVFFIPYDDVRDKKIRSEIMKQTLYHELLHQYFFYALGQQTAPPWFNEGLAQYYEYTSFKSRNNPSFRTDLEIEGRVAPALSTGFSTPAFLRQMDYPAFQQFHEVSYSAVFGLMYYLMKGAALEEKTSHYTRIPARYFNTLGKTGDPARADKAAWEGIDMEQLERDYRAFWQNRERRRILNDDSLPPFPAE